MAIKRLSVLVGASLWLSFSFAQDIPEMRAFPGVAFDSWTQGFKPGTGTNLDAEALRNEIVQVLGRTSDPAKFFEAMLSIQSRLTFCSADDFQKFSKTMLSLREDVRIRRVGTSLKTTDIVSRRRLLVLMQYLSEEALYVGKVQFPQMQNQFLVIFDSKNPIEGQANLSRIRDIPVRDGDFVTLKYSGHGISDFIAVSPEVPGLFSHTFPVMVDSASGQMLAPEAGIESGVRKSDVGSYNHASMVTRLVVMRPTSENPERAAELAKRASQGVRQVMKELEDAGGHFAYDLVFDILDRGGCQAYSCAETTWLSLSRGKILPPVNAQNVNSNLLSRFSPSSRNFFVAMLGAVSPRFVAPSDFETSATFAAVGVRIDISSLKMERVGNAVMDSLMRNIERDASSLNESIVALEHRADDPMTREQIGLLRIAGVPASLVDELSRTVGGPMSIKQALFFSFIQEVYTPRMREGLVEYVRQAEMQRRVVGFQELRAVAEKNGKPIVDEFSKMLAGLGQIASDPQGQVIFENNVRNLRPVRCEFVLQ